MTFFLATLAGCQCVVCKTTHKQLTSVEYVHNTVIDIVYYNYIHTYIIRAEMKIKFRVQRFEW